MPHKPAVLTVIAGPNEGDTVSLETGTCRLIGRHLSENETVLIDPDGNRLINGEAAEILAEQLKDRAPPAGTATRDFSVNAFERGPDIIFADNSISRAHAMVFRDEQGVGIIDLASTNGTFVNGQRVGTAFMANEDIVTVGNSSMAVRVP